MLRRCPLTIVAAVVLAWCGSAGELHAHDPGLSMAQGQWRDGQFELRHGIAPADARFLLPDDVSAGLPERWTPTDLERVQNALLDLAPRMWAFRTGGREVAPLEARVELPDGESLVFQLVYPLAPGGFRLRSLAFASIPAGHRCFVLIADDRGGRVATKLLGVHDDTLEVERSVPLAGLPEEVVSERSPPTALEFIKLGIEHIWTGYDHLLFLFGLLIVCRRFGAMVAIVSCFTVAHSITLALATWDIVTLPSRPVEAAIAASIVYVGVENLIRRGAEPHGRWALTFVFGLVHGFGFAGTLRELGGGGGGTGIAMPLFTFNLGVEIGQVAVTAAVLPIVWRLRRNATFTRLGIPALSAMVTVAGLYWLIERLLAN